MNFDKVVYERKTWLFSYNPKCFQLIRLQDSLIININF